MADGTEFRSGTLRGEVGLNWEQSGRPNWDLTRTIRQVEIEDQRLASAGSNPARVFRKARLRRDHDYVQRWTLGCKFPWLNPR